LLLRRRRDRGGYGVSLRAHQNPLSQPKPLLKRLSAFGRERDASWVNSVPEFDRLISVCSEKGVIKGQYDHNGDVY
jgi:hypothetical protein